jgi:phage terminase large subunit
MVALACAKAGASLSLGNMETEPPLFDFTNKPNQRAFFYDNSRVIAYFGGYGNGKTYAGCGKLWLQLEMIPGNVGLVGRKTYPALNSTTRETLLKIARTRNGGTLEEGPVIKSFNKADNVLTLQNGSVCFIRTLDEVEKLRSLNLGCALVDQGEEIAYEIYLELNGRIRYWSNKRVAAWREQHGQNMVKNYGFCPNPYNQLIIVGNPAPNWVKREFKDDKGKVNKLYEAPTHENIANLPEDYILEMEKRYPKEWIERFIMGSWDTFGGQIFKEFNPAGAHGVDYMEVPREWPVFVGWDHGITNPTAALVACVDEDGNIVLVDEFYKSSLTVDQYAVEVKECLAPWAVPKSESGDLIVHMDPSTKGSKGTGEISVWEAYRRHGIFGINANNDVEAGILWMQYLIRPDESHPFPKWHPRAGELGSPRFFVMRRQNLAPSGGCPNFINEMATYEWEPARAESNDTERPRKWKDHAIDAVRYLLMAVKAKRAEKTYSLQEAQTLDQSKKVSKWMEHVFTKDIDGEDTEQR